MVPNGCQLFFGARQIRIFEFDIGTGTKHLFSKTMGQSSDHQHLDDRSINIVDPLNEEHMIADCNANNRLIGSELIIDN